MKVIWIDTEDTGLNSFKNGVIQIAGMAVVDNEWLETFNYDVAPFATDQINDKALKVCGKTKEEIMLYPEPFIVYKQFVKMLGKYIDKYNKHDKFVLAGYNIAFDADMLCTWFKKNGDNYFYSYVYGGKLDVVSLVMSHCMEHEIFLPNHKLETVAHHFGIKADFHDALDDIKATKQIYQKIINYV